jgi:hypothetical protein
MVPPSSVCKTTDDPVDSRDNCQNMIAITLLALVSWEERLSLLRALVKPSVGSSAFLFSFFFILEIVRVIIRGVSERRARTQLVAVEIKVVLPISKPSIGEEAYEADRRQHNAETFPAAHLLPFVARFEVAPETRVTPALSSVGTPTKHDFLTLRD